MNSAKAKSVENDESNGKWVYGYHANVDTHDDIIIPSGAFICGCNRAFTQVDSSTVCYNTGLPDKNGNMIHTNDWVKLVLANGEVRIFKVVLKTTERVEKHPVYDSYSKVSIKGFVFQWQGMDLFPMVDEQGVPDNIKMEILCSSIDYPTLDVKNIHGQITKTNETSMQDFAKRLNGRDYGEEINTQEEQEAKELGLVVVFGESDDLCEFRGAIHDEVDCFDGGTAYFIKDRLLTDCEDEYEALKKQATNELLIYHDYSPEGVKFWEYQFKWHIDFAEFDIFDEGEPYCKGIVFRLADLK